MPGRDGPGESPRAAGLVEQGLREAAGISHPVARARHRGAWALRLSRLDPPRAAALLPEVPDDPEERARLLTTVVRDRVERGDTQLEPHFTLAFETARLAEPDARLHVLNDLSEAAIELGDRERDTALSLLRRLAPEARDLEVEGAEFQQLRVLAGALIGEALLLLDEEAGRELLNEAEALSEGLPARDPVIVFLANARAPREPERAAGLLEAVQDPALRLEARLQLAETAPDPEVRARLLMAAESDAALLDPSRGPEAMVRLGQAYSTVDAGRARAYFLRALDAAAGAGAQLRAIQLTGVAAVLAPFDREWAGRVFREAAAAAGEEEERIKRITALILTANEMAASFPREAAELLERAMEEAAGLEAMWEHAHVMDVLFRPDRSQYLDLAPARPLLERILARITDSDPRIPGVLGLPEVARCMADVDRDAAAEILRRWFRAAEQSGDSDGMTQAAAMLSEADPDAGREALRRAHDVLVRRVDCPAMGEYCRRAAPLAPDLVLAMAPHIPDRRERSDALAAAAAGLYPADPGAALEIVRGLERAADRSSALLTLADALLGTGHRPLPQPLAEELP